MLSLQPPTTISGFTGAPDTLDAMVQAAHGDRGERSMLVRSMTEEITKGLVPKDYLGEIVAIRNWVAQYVRYMNDPLHVELVKDPERLIEEYLARGVAVADCDEIACLIATMALQIGRVCEYVVAGFGAPGHYSHVFVRVLEPKSGKWIVCDPVAGTNERQMLGRITTYETRSLDE
jgi:hypothetical protein